MTTALVWFRRDLRLIDNSALNAALAAADHVIPVYIHDPAAEANWLPGAASRWWLHHSLAALAVTSGNLGSRLVLRRGDTATELRALIAETGAAAVYWNRLYEPHTVQRDAKLKAALHDVGISAESHAGCLLHEPMQLKTAAGQPFRVFTPFWKTFQRDISPATPLPSPRNLKVPPRWPSSISLESLGLLPTLDWADGFHGRWTPGEAGALTQLHQFLKRALPEYRTGREYPGRAGVSFLSPHLHFGELSPRQVWQAVQNADAPAGNAEAYLRELGWREFAHHVLFHFPWTTDQPMYDRFRAFPWRDDYAKLLLAWRRGETGYPIVDAGMRELWTTGWMHNRVRMIVASFLVKNLRISWQEGARWFWDTLVDADLANNTMGWQWSAGSGADAAPYFRVFNPVLQSRKFDPDGTYLRRWLPELAALAPEDAHAPWETGGRRIRYPAPVVDYAISRAEALDAYQKIRQLPESR
ncbi:MAG TPA: deoxyribodipyrimidine photo-lyase [Gammaproteobacteria bacterium]|nr:deoxyribodipyrimidine photo-lyase [Gammaproteobacteria bacterium]